MPPSTSVTLRRSLDRAGAVSPTLRQEQAEVGTVCARRAGGVFSAASAVHLLVLPPDQLLLTLPSLILMTIGACVQLAGRRAGRSGARAVLAGFVLDLVALAALLGPGIDEHQRAFLGGVTMLTSMALPAGLFAIGAGRRLLIVTGAALPPVAVLGAAATWDSGRWLFVVLSIVVCWALAVAGSRWLAGSVARARESTERLRTAHDAERRSSEREARRRSDARLMHDTILATLTLVAHRGEGIDPGVLRAQAASDLGLLRRLDATGREYAVQAAPTPPPLPEALVEVAGRYRERGLDVVWHGGTDVRLPAPRLDALARALGECLENVRRHSGATSADVTVEQDEEVVRVAVSDDGHGFDPAAVPAGRLGLAESVVGRLSAVGGGARVFSAPGAGTTVLLSVPR